MLKRRGELKAVLLALSIATVLTGAAHAQSSLGLGTAEPVVSLGSGGPLAPLFAWVNVQQQAFYRALTGALKEMRQNPWALWSLVTLSFTYGIFHAAGPGHGKAVISSYMIANETELKRGIVISFLSAMTQGLVAILAIGAAFFLLRGTGISVTKTTWGLEIASYALIVLFGLNMLWRKLRSMGRKPAVAASLFDDHDHSLCTHDHALAFAGAGGGNKQQAFVCDTCGHSHGADPAMLKGERFGISEAWAAIIAVGLRPCSGALLVLTFSLLNGLYLGGLLSVFAMSLGTAITVATLATLAVTAKDVAVRVAGGGSRLGMMLSNGIEILGAVMVIVFGLMLLGASLTA
ncbi:nickel/cobalt transporter [Rhizobium sp. PAMB 3182]